MRGLWIPGLLFCLCAATGRAEDLLPPERPIEEVVDHYLDAKLKTEGITAAPQATDVAVLRRTTLDLAGRIPLPHEVQAYIASTDPAKRVQLVDRLLASPDFAFHQRNEFNGLLMPTRDDGAWREWLLKVFQENRPWNQVFRQLLLTRDDDAPNKPALEFLKSRVENLDDVTNDTSKLFFGVSINCAKCHDHPLVVDWTQDHYFGLASFFNRTYKTKKNFLAERDNGLVRFKTTEGVEKEAKLMFLTGEALTEPAVPPLSPEEKKLAETREKEDNERETPPANPAWSRRSQLVELALKPDPNGFFPKSIVNRLWARLIGRGLVHPVDQMHSANPASHPELLSWLSRDMESHGYDLKRMVRGIVLSRAYARSSQWEQGERPNPNVFALASVRPMSPMQYSLSLLLATSHPEQLVQQTSTPELWTERRKGLENHAHGFSRQLEAPGEGFQVSVSEALLFSNSQHVQNEYLRDGGDKLVGRLKGLTAPEPQIQEAFLSVLSRTPEPDEVGQLTAYLTSRQDRPLPALQQLVWILLTGSEFRFNY